MMTCQKTTHIGWIGLIALVASIGTAAGQAYPPHDQRLIDQQRWQQELSRQRLGDDLRNRLQQQDLQRQQIQIEDRIRRQQLQDDLQRRQLR